MGRCCSKEANEGLSHERISSKASSSKKQKVLATAKHQTNTHQVDVVFSDTSSLEKTASQIGVEQRRESIFACLETSFQSPLESDVLNKEEHVDSHYSNPLAPERRSATPPSNKACLCSSSMRSSLQGDIAGEEEGDIAGEEEPRNMSLLSFRDASSDAADSLVTSLRSDPSHGLLSTNDDAELKRLLLLRASPPCKTPDSQPATPGEPVEHFESIPFDNAVIL